MEGTNFFLIHFAPTLKVSINQFKQKTVPEKMNLRNS